MIEYFFKEEIQAARQWLQWGMVICAALVVLYVIFFICTLFMPRLRDTLALINKTFGIILVLVVSGSSFGFGLSLRKEPEVIHVEPVRFPDVKLPDVNLPAMPDVTVTKAAVEEITDSAEAIVSGITEASMEVVDDVAAALAPPEPPSAEEIAKQQETYRMQGLLDTAHRQLLQESQRFAGGYGYGSLGLHTWSSRYQSRSSRKVARARLRQMEGQMKRAVDHTADRFKFIEEDLFAALNYGGRADVLAALDSYQKIDVVATVEACRKQAWKNAEQRRREMVRLKAGSMHSKIAQWRSQFMREELSNAANALRADWIALIDAVFDIQLR